MSEPKRARNRLAESLADVVDVVGMATFGSGAAAGVAFGRFLLGGALTATALGVYLRFARRRRLRR
ncbi:hypothetical protein [Roseateles paludis]|jgi:uncharacterized membrane protein|uniref:Uncharacterized protein n=1 Tax=Roseateles paludis TaxID=3145238 RepID=A0ABV0FVA9_9BURK